MNEIQNIDTLTAEILILKQQTAQNIIEIGKRLIEAQNQLGEGETFRSWLKEKVQFSKSTAYNFIRAAKEFNDVQALGQLGQTKVFAILDLPPEEREDFISTPHEIKGQIKMVDEMTTRELKQVIKEKQELEAQLKCAEKKAEEEHRAWETVSKSYERLEKTNNKHYKEAEKLKKELEKLKDEKKNSEKEIEKLKMSVEDTKMLISEAKASGNDKEVEELQQSLSEKESSLFEANKKIKELEEQLKEKPIDVKETIIEKIPEEVEKELQELRAKVSQASSSTEPTIKFSIYFQELVKGFKELLGSLTEIEDAETKDKYKKAVSGLINKMLDTL